MNGEQFHTFDAVAATKADGARRRPVVKRLLQDDGANLITFNFAPGQELPEHSAVHPIVVQCVAGQLDFECEGKRWRMEPGMVTHVRARVSHAVYCPEDAAESNVLLLTMLTGEKHSEG